MPDQASITYDDLSNLNGIISHLIPDRASFDHFSSTLRKRKICITVFDESLSTKL